MGSSKTANALMVKFNYEDKGYKVALMKPSIDTRDGTNTISSRIGLSSECLVIDSKYDFADFINNDNTYDVIIIDEAQFLTSKQIEQLKYIAVNYIPVICYGLKTDFQSFLFEGSKRLLELADSVTEIKSVCKCGKKAECNVRINKNKEIIKSGEQIQIGGNESYVAMCYRCWIEG